MSEITEYYDDDGVYYYQGLPDDLDNLESYDALKDIISPPLKDMQSVDLLRALFMGRYAFFYATGLGKTYLSAAFMKGIRNIRPRAKFLMFVKKSQQSQTPKKIYNISGLKCKFYSAKATDILSIDDVDRYDVIMMTHDSLSSFDHIEKLSRCIDRFDGIIADEAHLLANFEEAISAQQVLYMSQRVKYFIALTATPITRDVEQLARVLKIVAPDAVGNYRKLASNLKQMGLAGMPKNLQDLFVVRDRTSNRKGYAVWVDPMPHQYGASGRDLFKITKGHGAENQGEALVNLIRDKRPLRGIVYVNLTECYDFLKDYLASHGIRAGIINGKVTDQKVRDKILEDFANDRLDVILTNTKEAVDMDCNYAVFYEYTCHVKQVIGRGERGFDPITFEVFFMFTKETEEFDYFKRNVLEISQEVQELLELDYGEITDMNYARFAKKSNNFK